MRMTQKNHQLNKFNISWLPVPLMPNKIPWIQKKLIRNIVDANPQICCSSKINNLECARF